MKFKTLILALILVISSFGISFQTLAEKPMLGLSKGDVFYYEMYAEYRSENSSGEIRIPAFEANNTSWVRIEITDVSESVVSHNYTLHFKDGSERRIASQTDLSDPSGYSEGFRGVPLCQANLDVGDSLLGGHLVIDEIRMQSFSTGKRQLVHTSWKSEIDYGECYFDRQTGVLTELFHVHLYINPKTNEIVNKTDVVKLIY